MCLDNLPQTENKLKFIDNFINNENLTNIIILLDQAKPFLAHKDNILNSNSIILLQNNTEIRPTGGFIGSYAKIISQNHSSDGDSDEIGSSSDGGILPKISFHDIYVPDGQISLKGHVEPPPAIQTAFQQGEYRLVNANFEPDFITSATTLRWFFEHGGETNPNFLIAVNLGSIKKALDIIGPFQVPEYNVEVTSNNAYALLQNQAEINFFPGSTQKKDAFTAVGKALFKKINSLSLSEKLKLAKLALEELNNNEILINSDDQNIQKLLEEKSWAGQFPPQQKNPSSDGDISSVSGGQRSDSPEVRPTQDFYASIETNLGANKANTFITRQTNHTITSGTDPEVTEVIHKIQVIFKNSSPFENPTPPRFYGGNYINFIRFYIPKNATNIDIQATQIPNTPELKRFKIMEEPKIDMAYELTQISFFHITLANQSSEINISYDLPAESEGLPAESEGYSLTLYKQPGIENSPQYLNIFGQIKQLNLQKNTTIL
jgi:hypothetical protein